MKQDLFKLLNKVALSSTYVRRDGKYNVDSFKIEDMLKVISKHIDLKDFELSIKCAFYRADDHKDFAWEPAKWQKTNIFFFMKDMTSSMEDIGHLMNLYSPEKEYKSSNTEGAIVALKDLLQPLLSEESNPNLKEGIKRAIDKIEIFIQIGDTLPEEQFPFNIFLGSAAAVDKYEENLKKTVGICMEVFNQHTEHDYSEITSKLQSQYDELYAKAEQHRADLAAGKYDWCYERPLSTWESLTHWYNGTSEFPKDNIGHELSEIVNKISIPDDVNFAAIKAELDWIS